MDTRLDTRRSIKDYYRFLSKGSLSFERVIAEAMVKKNTMFNPKETRISQAEAKALPYFSIILSNHSLLIMSAEELVYPSKAQPNFKIPLLESRSRIIISNHEKATEYLLLTTRPFP